MTRQLKILHIEDNVADAGLIARELKQSGIDFTIKVVETKNDYSNALKNYNPDIILSDHSLPQFDSIEALSIYNENNFQIPFILITGSVSEEFAIRCIKEGADDYILKNNLIRLPSAIKQALKSRQVEADKRKVHLELEATNKELNTFIYKAAHDLRGPLCSIMGLTNLATMEGEKENLKDYIHKISESTLKLDAILLSLIDVMTIKDTQPVLNEIDLKSLVDSVIKRLKYIEGYEALKFKIKIENKKGFFSDESILNSVLYNILENAIKYRNMSHPGPFVDVKISNTDTGIKIEIEDNGIGIDGDIKDRIFEMYFRGNEDSKGSGLGLYLVANGIKKLGGTVCVESKLNNGSVFTIVLPSNLILT
ncbi:MAG: ATP-binding protein [Bacteroidota bacterium]|nr:ATP-binding protein [Bacteroidota bacterium]